MRGLAATCVALLLLGAVARGTQAPVTLVSGVDASGDGQALITNRTSVPLTAYLVQVFLEPCNPSPRPDAFLAFDAAQTPGGAPLLPSKTRAEPLGTAHCNKVGNSVPGRAELKAAVYEDGTSFGERRWVEAIVASRQSQLARITAVLQGLGSGAATVSPEAWTTQLDGRLQALESTRAELFPPNLDVRRLALESLAVPHSRPEQIARTRTVFEQLRDQLLKSLPELR